jgi:hypothetical protein
LLKPAHHFDKASENLNLAEARKIKKIFQDDAMDHLKIDLDAQLKFHNILTDDLSGIK